MGPGLSGSLSPHGPALTARSSQLKVGRLCKRSLRPLVLCSGRHRLCLGHALRRAQS